MTTAGEIRQLVDAGAAEARRVVFLPSSVLTTPAGIDSFAREVAALANREGGRVVLGVSASGIFEEQPAVAREVADAAIAEALTRRIVPPVEAAVEHIVSEAGEALVVRLLARSGPPHRAPAANGSGEPAVFVRLGDRTRAATPEQVSWMERVRKDPAIERAWTLATAAGPDDCGVDPAAPIAEHYRELLERAPASLLGQMRASAEARVRACAELAPWVFLLDLGAALAPASVERVSLDDLAQPGSRSMIGTLPGGIAALLGEAAPSGLLSRVFGRRAPRPSFRVPRGAEPHVDLLLHQRKGRAMLVHPGWVVTFAAAPAGEGAEAGSLRLELACSLVFPERDGQIESQRQAERIVERAVRAWSAPAD